MTPTGGIAADECAAQLLAGLSPAEKVGQLIMVGAEGSQGSAAVDNVLEEQHAGGVLLLGSWNGATTVAASVTRWQDRGKTADGGIGLLVAADQEGGQVERLTGAGFTTTPSALTQGTRLTEVAQTAAAVGNQLAAAGVGVNLAPVADTVAVETARKNGPIGAYDREYGHDPAIVAAAVQEAVRSLQGAGVSATLKHFPGLGRVTGNTDVTASGTTDGVTSADDPYLRPFKSGIDAGADLVMVSTALYPRLDPDHRAAFSQNVVTGLLRERLGFAGVVITDDVGVAKSVTAVPIGDRATQFIAAGGDIVLTVLPSTVPPMTTAVLQKAAASPAFSTQVDAAVKRILVLKLRRGLAGC